MKDEAGTSRIVSSGLILIGLVLTISMVTEHYMICVLLLGVPCILFLLAGSPVRVLMSVFALQIILTIAQLTVASIWVFRIDDLLTILFLSLWLLSLPDRSMSSIRIGKQGVFIIIFLVLFVVSAYRGYAAGHNVLFIYYQVKTFGPYLLYFPLLWVLSDEKNSRWLWKLLLISAVISGLIYTIKGYMRSGEDVYIRETTGVRVTTRQPNAIGAIMLIFLGRLWKDWKERPTLILIIPALILMSSAILLSQTRGIWGGCVLALAAAWILNLFRKKDNIRIGRKLMVSITTLAVLIIFMVFVISTMGILSATDIAERTGESSSFVTSTSTLSRLIAWSTILEDLRGTAIITGKGLGAVYTCFRPDIGAVVTVYYVDSSYFQIALNMGLIGVLVFLAIFMITLVRAVKLFINTDSRLRAGISMGVFCAVIMLLFASGFASVLTHYRFTMLWAFLLALLQTEIIRDKRDSNALTA
ncbi:MAG: hypothetical protein GQ565_05880 [Candidatus Aegiribacteria sp.]|nr:hypothetical protein [Candidatus Aegiribacteria sp.]